MKGFIAIVSLFVYCLFVAACSDPASVSKSNAHSTTTIKPRYTPSNPFDQTLFDNASVAEGGRLYDKWWALTDGSGMLGPVPDEATITHPLWPGSNTRKSDSTTWRCKSCHGWDYRGVDGINGLPGSSNYTGIKGIVMRGGDITTIPANTTPEDIYYVIRDGVSTFSEIQHHSFSGVLSSDEDAYRLAKFVFTVQTEAANSQGPGDLIDSHTGLVNAGDLVRGEALFQTTDTVKGGCAGDCHGTDGRQIDFAAPLQSFVDTHAREYPSETLHKIRFGVPGSGANAHGYMLGLEDYGANAVLDAASVLAYAQEKLISSTQGFDFRKFQNGASVNSRVDFARGGILWDKWWTGTNETAALTVPADITCDDASCSHPLWHPEPSNINPVLGTETWQCTSCHGWDYAGNAGSNGKLGSRYFTGIKGVIAKADTNSPINHAPAEIYDFIAAGSSSNLNQPEVPEHAFANRLSGDDIYALTRFVVDVQTQARHGDAPYHYIANQPYPGLGVNLVSEGSSVKGIGLYDAPVEKGGCAIECHGSDGRLIATESGKFLDALAKQDPWRVLHKVRFGHPGTVMQGLEDYNVTPDTNSFTVDDAADIVAYAQFGLSRDYVRGGRLYDNWIVEKQMYSGMLDNFNLIWTDWIGAESPFYPQNIEDSWRCSQCHGWDYEGLPGVYNDLLWLRGLRNWSPGDVYKKLKYGYNAWNGTQIVQYHSFGFYLNERDLWDMADFAMRGVVDTYAYISLFGEAYNGSRSNGRAIYNGAVGLQYQNKAFSCVQCHGAAGSDVIDSSGNPVNIFSLSWENPWRFFHTVKFGAPGKVVPENPTTPLASMPGLFELTIAEKRVLVEQDAVNVMDFAQDAFINTLSKQQQQVVKKNVSPWNKK